MSAKKTCIIKYVFDENEASYWSQWCNLTDIQPLTDIPPNRPNAMFLLLRDISFHPKNAPDALGLTVQLSRWRNSLQPSILQEELCKELPGLLALSEMGDWNPWLVRDKDALFIRIARRITQLHIHSGSQVPAAFLDLLRWRFECQIIDAYSVTGTPTCLFTPLSYRDSLKAKKTNDFVSLHHAFTVLLARNLDNYSGTERVDRIKEVIIML